MRAPVSVVIPTLNSVEVLRPTTQSLIEGISSDIIRELVLSDGGSTDGISEFADLIGAKLVSGPKGRGNQLGAGAIASDGPWMLFLHSDTCLSPGWSTAVANHISSLPEMAAYFRLRFRASGPQARCVARWANFRSTVLGLPYGDQGPSCFKKTIC